MWVILFRHKRKSWISSHRSVYLTPEHAQAQVAYVRERHPTLQTWIVPLPDIEQWKEVDE